MDGVACGVVDADEAIEDEDDGRGKGGWGCCCFEKEPNALRGG